MFNHKKVIFICMSLLFVTFSSFGFWSLLKFNTHAVLTKEGLSTYKYTLTDEFFKKNMPDGKESLKRGFVPVTLSSVAKDSEFFDRSESGVKDNHDYHCDDERIVSCSRLVVFYKKSIIKGLVTVIKISGDVKSSLSTGEINRLRTMFGKSLHTLEDFYSHSNWVERSLHGTKGKIRLRSFFKPKTGSVKVNTDFFLNETYSPSIAEGTTCVTGPAYWLKNLPRYNDLYLDYLTTGYYKKSKDIYYQRDIKDSPFTSVQVQVALSVAPFCNIPSLDKNEKTCTIYNKKVPLGYTATALAPKSFDGPYFPDPNRTIEKCIHSDSIRGFKGNYVGLAKDHETALYNTQAFNIAELATREYLKSIVDEVVKQNGKGARTDWVILKFLGYDVQFPDEKPVIGFSGSFRAINESETSTIPIKLVKGDSKDIVKLGCFSKPSGLDLSKSTHARLIITNPKYVSGNTKYVITCIAQDKGNKPLSKASITVGIVKKHKVKPVIGFSSSFRTIKEKSGESVISINLVKGERKDINKLGCFSKPSGLDLSKSTHARLIITNPEYVSGVSKYVITCIARDKGNKPLSKASITIKILKDYTDRVKPVIKIIGSDTVTIKIGETYVDRGATATDNRDGTVNVSRKGSVNINKAGTYAITYTAKDKAGNVAVATRIVIVKKSAVRIKKMEIEISPRAKFYRIGSDHLKIVANFNRSEIRRRIKAIDSLIWDPAVTDINKAIFRVNVYKNHSLIKTSRQRSTFYSVVFLAKNATYMIEVFAEVNVRVR